MAQQVKVFASRPDDPSFISGSIIVEGKNQTLQVVL